MKSTIIGKMNFFVWCLLAVSLFNNFVDVKGQEIVESQSSSSDASVHPDIADKTVRHYKKHYAPKVVPKEVIETETVYHVEKSSSETATLWDNIFNIPIATLKAVNELVKGITSNLGGVSVTKTHHKHLPVHSEETEESSQ